MPYAAKQAFIYRREAAGSKNEIPVELRKIMDRKNPDVPLLANDILYIPDNKNRRLSASAIDRVLGFARGLCRSPRLQLNPIAGPPAEIEREKKATPCVPIFT